ncbi:MAG: hypothetical protein LBE62_00350 [Azonexus sp.]|jgi:hypothetical protein|nr:hypothetical protein [Azonexus sp.]
MLKVIGLVFFFAGCFGVYWSGKRAFERRNIAGVEEFSSYGKAVGLRAFEGLVKIISWLSIAIGFVGFCLGWGMGR